MTTDVQRVDFIAVPTRDRERSARFYGETLGLERNPNSTETWTEFETAAPELAEVAARLWPGITALARGEPVPDRGPCFRVSYLATVRPDGSPRLHPFCPVLSAGRLYAAIPMSSPKGNDLRRDPRCVIHAMPGRDDDDRQVPGVGHRRER